MENWSGRSIKGYELLERLGTGGFGAVYRANQSTIGREVAMKIILPHFANHPDFIRRFESEAQLVARLEHMHIVPLYDYWRDPDGAYLVMRWLRGGSLRDALQNKPFDIEATALLLDQITAALAVAHRNNIIHRDLKPGNILLDEDGNAYLADFGIAKDVSQPGITEIDAIIGSSDYLAPEQAGSEPVTPRTDIYSLGIVLYEVLTGQYPFPNLHPVERLYKHLNEPLPNITLLPEDVNEGVNRVIQKATAKNPAHRYPDAVAMALAFHETIRLHPAETLIETLTQRDHDILSRIIAGQSNKQIAAELVVTVGTVKWYVNRIFRKLNVRNRVQAIVRARELNLIVAGGVSATSLIQVPAIPTEDFQPENPYKGLRAFQAADNQDFFGREKLIQKLVTRLSEAGDYARFLAVLGPSGSGKSSLVKSGFIPALWRGEVPGSEKWFVVEMLPGSHPLEELEIALMRIAARQSGSLREQLTRDKRGLLRAAQLVLPDDDSEIVLIIDQFEEVFTLMEDEAARVHFLSILQTAISDPRSRLRVIVTLRADFYDRPLHYPDFGELIRNRIETVLPLGVDELERAIAKPAERVGAIFDPGLVASIVGDVHYQPGALPLLQFALTELFERRRGRMLTHEAYHEMGGTVGALAKRAEQIYAELTPEGQETIRQMFLRLVTLGEGVEDTRRRVARSELLAIANDPEDMDEIIDTFTAYRLLSLDNDPATRSPTVELAHEAILREWERLRGWLNDSRQEIRLQRQLAGMATDWERANKDASFLAHGSRLEQFQRWKSDTQLALTAEEHEYLRASIVERDLQEAAEQVRQAREKQLERRSLTFVRVLVGVLLLATVGAFGLMGVAVSNANEAQNNFMIAERIRLAAQAQIALDHGEGGELPALLALHSLRFAYSQEADAALLRALSRGFAEQEYIGHSAPVADVVFSPDGQSVLTAGTTDNSARLWNAQTGHELRRFLGHTGPVYRAVFSPDGQTILTVSGDATARLWDTQTGQEIRRFVHPSGVVLYCADISPDGRYAATGGSNHVIQLWDVKSGQEVRQFIGHEGEIWWIMFSPDGQNLITSSEDRTVRLWDVQTGEELRQFLGHANGVSTVRFSPDGHYLITASLDKSARLWDVQTGEELRQFLGHTEDLFDAAFSPDGRFLVTTSFDKTARLWDVQTGAELRQFLGHTAAVAPAVFSPDGQYLLTGSYDWTARLWSIRGPNEPRTFSKPYGFHYGAVHIAQLSSGMQSIIVGAGDSTARIWNVQSGEMLSEASFAINLANDMDFSSDNRYALTAGDDGIARLWNIETGDEIRQFIGHTGSIWSVIFSADDHFALTTSLDGTARLWDVEIGEALHIFSRHNGPVRTAAMSSNNRFIATGGDDFWLWDVQTGQEVRQLIGHTQPVQGISFSPDSQHIISGSEDETARLWDVQTGQEVRRFIGHTEPIWTVAFSPDGKYILTGSVDETARLWDVQTAQAIRQFVGHQDAVRFVAFSPDGQYVLTADPNIAYLWRTNIHDLIEYACAGLPRDLTDDEHFLYTINEDAPTCPVLVNRVNIVEPTWTPFVTSAAPRPTMAPLAIQMVFSNDSANVSMGVPVQDVFLDVGDHLVMRPLELNPETLSQPVFSTIVGQEADFLDPPYDAGPFRIGKPLGFTLSEWLAARGTGTYIVIGDRAILDLGFENLIPNGVYSLWCVQVTWPPNTRIVEEPCGAPDGSDNSFLADEAGNGAIRLEIDAFPPSTEQTFYDVSIAYHSDGQTHGAIPGNMGRDAHVQLFYDFLAPSS